VTGVALAGLLVGLSPVYTMMVAALLVMGALGGGYHPVASPLVSDGTPVEKRGRVLGIHQIGGTAANIITPPLAAAIAAAFAATIGWRGSYIVLTAPIIVFGLYLNFVMRRRHIGDTPRVAVTQTDAIIPLPKGFLRRMIAFVVLGTAVQVFVFSSLSFVTLLVVDQYTGSEQLGAALFALSQFSGLFAGPIGGHLSDRIGKVPMILVAGLASGPLIYLLGLSANWWLLAIVLLALGCCMYIAMPVSEAYVISHASPRNRSTSLGIYYFASRGGPGVLSLIIGGMLDRFGFGTAFTYTGGVMFAIAIICSFMLWGSKE
jgi:MFS family permease